jgi:hypothetical protein
MPEDGGGLSGAEHAEMVLNQKRGSRSLSLRLAFAIRVCT